MNDKALSVTMHDLLKVNVDLRVARVKSGMFNIIIVFGATRSGKSTITRQIAHYMSKEIGVPFTLKDNVTFEADKLVEMANNPDKLKWCFVLDEASNDLMSADRGNRFQLLLTKFYNIAAKYNQTHFILLPNLQQLKKDFLTDFHTCGLETVIKYDAKNKIYLRGRGRAYSRHALAKLHDAWKKGKLNDAMTSSYHGFTFTFTPDEPYWTPDDEQEYQTMKDEFIANLGKKLIKKKDKGSDDDESI
jgi:hypothetical protein